MATNTYKNVLLVGASGDVGKSLLPNLLADSDFKVSVLSRADSSPSFPANVNVIKVDYSDRSALVKAFTGQDVVVSAIGGEALLKNLDKVLIETALAAGVKWFIPSEYGFDLDDPSASTIPFNTPSLQNVELLKQNQSRIAHTLITTGAFLDQGLDTAFLGFDIPNQTATIYDDGTRPVSGTLIKELGKAVVAILHHPEQTLNQRICLAHATFTQQEVLALLEKYTDAKWTVNHVTTQETLKQANEEWTKGNWSHAAMGYIIGLAYSGTGVCHFGTKTKNKALGLETASLEQTVQEAIQRKQAAAR